MQSSSLLFTLAFSTLIYFNLFNFSFAQDLYDIDETLFKRSLFPMKKDTDQNIREIRNNNKATGKPKNQDSNYADEHFNFDTLAGIGLGKRSPSSRMEHFNFDTLAGIGLGKRSPKTSRFAQARNLLANQFGKPTTTFLLPSSSPHSNKNPEKRFLTLSDLNLATGFRVTKNSNNPHNKKKMSLPFLWL